MKKSFVAVLLMLTAVLLPAAELTFSNQFLKICAKTDGSVEVTPAGAGKPYAVIRPDFNGGKVTPRLVKRRDCQLLMLRGENELSSLAVAVNRNTFSISLNRTGKPIKIEWPAAAVVLPDRAAEDIVLTPGDQARRLPGFINLYLGLLGKGEAALACIPVKNTADAVLSADLKSLEIDQKNTEEHIFVLNYAPGAWHKVNKLPADVKGITVNGWKPPYPAAWIADYPVKKGFLNCGDDLHMYWNIITVGKDVRHITNRLPRMAMVDHKTRRTWNGGFEATYRYPAEFIDGKAVLFLPAHRSDRFSYDMNKPVYIYAWMRLKDKVPAQRMPSDMLPGWKKADSLWRTVNVGASPTTCSTTADFEKIFYRDEAAEKKNDIINSLWSMQCFVESIRSRVENARVWADNLRKYSAAAVQNNNALSDDAAKLEEMLKNVDDLYNEALPRIKHPEEMVKLSAQVIALAGNDRMDEEEKENKAKELGRAIRTIGGSQDNLSASMRRVGKDVRQRTVLNYSTAGSDAQRTFWKHVWDETAEMLQGTYGHDGK